MLEDEKRRYKEGFAQLKALSAPAAAPALVAN